MCRYCKYNNNASCDSATKSLCGECVWVSKWAAQLKTILVAKWEVPVSKRERLPKRVVTCSLLLHCGCVVGCRGNCKYMYHRTGLRCSTLCKCEGGCTNNDNKAIRDGKYLALPHSSAWRRSKKNIIFS